MSRSQHIARDALPKLARTPTGAHARATGVTP
jgi:hypothetical protein